MDRNTLAPGRPPRVSVQQRYGIDSQGWVYSKPPLGGPEQVLEYLARYTHRVALSNHRLVRLANGKVTFTYKDQRVTGKDPTLCAQCGHGHLRRVRKLPALARRPPP